MDDESYPSDSTTPRRSKVAAKQAMLLSIVAATGMSLDWFFGRELPPKNHKINRPPTVMVVSSSAEILRHNAEVTRKALEKKKHKLRNRSSDHKPSTITESK